MNAAVYTKNKSGKILEIKNVEQPIPKDHGVVLRVRAASINPLDWRLKTERPGVDVAGEIVAVGRMVTRFRNVGNRALPAMKRVLAPDGKCVIAGAPKTMSAVLTKLLQILAHSILLRENFKMFVANINRADLTSLAELITAGKIHPVIDRRYPLTETAAAMAYAEEGHARAKVLITFQ
jgi:NADPH:quinone reductase-like Zn-dependent oxidoreductase